MLSLCKLAYTDGISTQAVDVRDFLEHFLSDVDLIGVLRGAFLTVTFGVWKSEKFEKLEEKKST